MDSWLLKNEVLLQDINERKIKSRAYHGRKRPHMPIDRASSAKYLEEKRAAEGRLID